MRSAASRLPRALLLAAVAVGGGCQCRGERAAPPPPVEVHKDAAPVLDARRERVVITRVIVNEEAPDAEVEIYPRLIAQELAQTLAETPWFEARIEDVSPTLRARQASLEVAVRHEAVAGEQGLALLVTLEAELRWEDGGRDPAPVQRVGIESPLVVPPSEGASGLTDEFKAAVAREVARAGALAAHGLIAMESIRSGDSEHLLEALRSAEDPTAQRFAIELARDRKLTAARLPLEQLLATDSTELDVVIGALVAIGDPASVRALAELPTRGDPELLHTTIEAIGLLGGEDARAYLEVVASGHPDQALRAHAAQVLGELERRQPTEPPREAH